MDEVEFWRIIENAKMESQGDLDREVEIITDMLKRHSADEILIFDAIHQELHDRAEREDLFNASTIFKTSISDDAFHYFRGWLVAQGQAVYEAALRDPDTLVEIVDETRFYGESECEEMLYVAMDAYKAVTGHDIPSHGDYRLTLTKYDWEDKGAGHNFKKDPPHGNYWIDVDYSQIFPRLWAKFGDED